MDENEVIKIRKKKVTDFFKKNYRMISYIVLAVIVYVAVKIRTSNTEGLRDITTGGWTLGPDLDPFLFLRWAKYIVENGYLFANDVMRYVPIGFDTSKELVLHVYLITWFHEIAAFFGSQSVTQSAALYPAFMFGIAMIAFFFMTRKIFIDNLGASKSNLIALVATFFLSVIPALLPRTIAGIPEKEASGIVFMFLAFYFFLVSWKAEGKAKMYIFAVLAGLATGGMGLVWGGYLYVTLSIGVAGIVAFVLGKIDVHKLAIYGIWLIITMILMVGASERFAAIDLLVSTSVGPAIFVFFIMAVDYVLFNTGLKKKLVKGKLAEWPKPLTSFVFSIVLGVLIASILIDPMFVPSKIGDLKNTLVTPTADRLGVTVAENRQPFFSEWAQSFGPTVRGMPLTFWLFFVGSIHLFYFAMREFKKERGWLTLGFAIFLVALVFSRYSQSSTLNGTNTTSLFFYALGPIIFVAIFGRYYFKKFRSEEWSTKLRNINFGLIFLLSFFIISLISARSAVRLIMMLAPSASIIVAYFAVAPAASLLKVKDSFWKIVYGGVVAIILISTIFSGYGYYNAIKASAPNHVPSSYTYQWQKAMNWTRVETQEGAVFGHWWDYGYWVQTIGERATVLDGGNVKPYWNHMMGRYALTGPDERLALEFLYAHNTTHFLIDSTDIGKYSAFSSIGSDENYDRASFLPTFQRDNSQTQERKNSTVFVYAGGAGLDGDIVYDDNGTRVFLPSGKAGLGAILIEKNSDDEVISNPQGIFVYEGVQYTVPFRYVYDGELKDFRTGINASVFLMPRAEQQGGSVNIQQDGALIYLSERVAHSQLAKLYLYKQETGAFKLTHSEDDLVVASMKSQGALIENDIILFGGVRGPIRIWEIDYPEDIEFDGQYLSEVWPEELRRV